MIYTLRPENFCALNFAIWKVQTFWASGLKKTLLRIWGNHQLDDQDKEPMIDTYKDHLDRQLTINTDVSNLFQMPILTMVPAAKLDTCASL